MRHFLFSSSNPLSKYPIFEKKQTDGQKLNLNISKTKKNIMLHCVLYLDISVQKGIMVKQSRHFKSSKKQHHFDLCSYTVSSEGRSNVLLLVFTVKH